VISIDNGHIQIETPEGSLIIILSGKDGIALINFETDLGNKEGKEIEISTRNGLIYQFVFKQNFVFSSKLEIKYNFAIVLA